ncbi:MAG TPA: ribonuclease HI [Clostridia bacterium]|nr:ribonuclease HI [Clostridia bacterium]
MKKVEIYTDGACSGNPGNGGWAAVLLYKSAQNEIRGAEHNTTNNRMELMAIIQGLKALKAPCAVTVFSDSAYAVNAFNEGWLTNWQRLNWHTTNKKEVKNIDLWQQLLELNNTHQIKFVKVKGHSDNKLNNRCDELARKAIEELVLNTDISL